MKTYLKTIWRAIRNRPMITVNISDNASMYTVRGVGDDGKETDIPHRCPLYRVLQIGE